MWTLNCNASMFPPRPTPVRSADPNMNQHSSVSILGFLLPPLFADELHKSAGADVGALQLVARSADLYEHLLFLGAIRKHRDAAIF